MKPVNEITRRNQRRAIDVPMTNETKDVISRDAIIPKPSLGAASSKTTKPIPQDANLSERVDKPDLSEQLELNFGE